MAFFLFGQKAADKKGKNPRICLDPSHNNTIPGWQVYRNSVHNLQELIMEPRQGFGAKYKNCLSPCFPFLRRQKKELRVLSNIPRLSYICQLNSNSNILTDNQVRSIENDLPSTSVALPWTLSFSTHTHGFSLHTLYRKLAKTDSPVLLVIEDTNRNIFGAYSSHKFEISQKFYGTHDCFLFTTHPIFQDYKGSGQNNFFIMGTQDALILGSDDGTPALWIDSDLNRGCTERCNTFENPPLIPERDFVIRTLECWTFG